MEVESREITCGNSCGHFDIINQCCWIVSKRGLCSDVEEGDPCLYGKVEVGEIVYSRQEFEAMKQENRKW